jgi:hypothetical protein
VLEAGAVLREEVRPVLRERADLIHSRFLVAMYPDTPRRCEKTDRCFALPHDERIGAIQEYPKPEDSAGMGGDQAVAKVEAQEVRVGVSRHDLGPQAR